MNLRHIHVFCIHSVSDKAQNTNEMTEMTRKMGKMGEQKKDIDYRTEEKMEGKKMKGKMMCTRDVHSFPGPIFFSFLWKIDHNNRLARVFEIPQVLFVLESE